MSAWAQPQEVSAVQQAFPAGIGNLLPSWGEIPAEFQEGWISNDGWCGVVARMFHLRQGVKLTPKEGIDVEHAKAHLWTVLGSFEPKHEHKIAGVAYLMSLWFEEPDWKAVAS